MCYKNEKVTIYGNQVTLYGNFSFLQATNTKASSGRSYVYVNIRLVITKKAVEVIAMFPHGY